MKPTMSHEMREQRGFTLVELMIVIVIVAILSSLAMGSYRRYMLRANRVDATSVLLQVQVAQEKFFLQNRRYASGNAELTAAPDAAPPGLGIPATTQNLLYTLTLNAPTATTYTATATAVGAQAQDTTCPTFAINEQGTRTPATASGCWR
jgi:type IV pilus assembly protein PilE